MKEQRLEVTSERGEKKVKLHNDGYGLQLLTMRNGYQWTGAGVDEDIIEMVQEVLEAYQESKRAKKRRNRRK